MGQAVQRKVSIISQQNRKIKSYFSLLMDTYPLKPATALMASHICQKKPVKSHELLSRGCSNIPKK